MYKALFFEGHGIFNLAADGAINNKDLAKVLNKKYIALSSALLKFLLFIGKSTGLSKYGPEQLLFIQFRPVLDNQKLKKEFGYVPEKSSLDSFKYYLKQHNISYTQDKINVEFPS
jgi:UDP-glucose 4-epimerase